MEVISKELLSVVLDIPLHYIENVELRGNILFFEEYLESWQIRRINIHELKHECKEWASKEGFHFNEDVQGINIRTKTLDLRLVHNVTSDKEYDINLTFKACQWILENKNER